MAQETQKTTPDPKVPDSEVEPEQKSEVEATTPERETQAAAAVAKGDAVPLGVGVSTEFIDRVK